MIGSRRLPINSLLDENAAPSAGRAVNGSSTNRATEVHRFSENGRDYYAFRNEVVYPFPLDEAEKERLDQLHCLIHDVALEKNLMSLKLTARHRRLQALDVGHGTGIWLYEAARERPEIDFFGIDLIDNQSEVDDIPNVTFNTPVDFTSPDWGFQDNSLDFIRMSQLLGCVSSWSAQYATVFKYLRPGTGWVEHIEIDWAPRYAGQRELPAELQTLQTWWAYMLHASSLSHRSIEYRDDTENLLINAGFVDIQHKTYTIRLQANQRDVRDATLKRWFQNVMCWPDADDGHAPPSFESLSLSLLTRAANIPPDQVRVICDALRAIYVSGRWPLYHNIHIWTARKPMS